MNKEGIVNVNQFSYLVKNDNWTTAVKEAINKAKNSVVGKILPIFFPPNGTYTLTEPLPLYSGLFFYSTMNNSEFANKAIIKNEVSDIFTFPNGDVTDVNFIGLEFRGNAVTKSTRFIQSQKLDNGHILKYSAISHCGFNFFLDVIQGRLLGTKIERNFINNGLGSFEISGSDCIISHNFIDNASAIEKNSFLVSLRGLSLSKFENNFLTGSIETGKGCMPLMIEGGMGLVITSNWFDFSEGSGLYLLNTESNVLRDNTFRKNVRAPFDQYTAIITMFDTRNCLFTGNQFIDQPIGAKTFSFRKIIGGTKKITIRDNVYATGYDLIIEKPVGESSDIFIDEPTSTYSKTSDNKNKPN
ncbi:right-handed parallel beta-helix repeat-containing protein [Peribacillus frigoritolerans]|uniref:right-handed parallel beta-helix repeat-containing protein n=1 Tax=Peribacillus frigoritolerans TaxID=450367 RepID=UPI002E1DC195|nr:right-handed parallel beta-helix repeat-containing protein [Peribacillus frigoritolerans]